MRTFIISPIERGHSDVIIGAISPYDAFLKFVDKHYSPDWYPHQDGDQYSVFNDITSFGFKVVEEI